MMAEWSRVSYAETRRRGRIDAAYYQPFYRHQQLELERQLRSGSASLLGDLADVEYGYMPMQDYVTEEDGEPLLRVTNIRTHLEVDDSDLKHIPLGLSIPAKKRLRNGDVLLVQCGDTTGKVGLIDEKHEGMLFPSFCLAVRSKGEVTPEILGIFLFSLIGQRQIKQSMTISTVRPNTTKPDVERLVVPHAIMSTDISEGVRLAVRKREESKALYASAEGLLLSELGLGELDLSPTLFYERDFSEAQQAARLDAEYFQPKHYTLIDALRQSGKSRLLGDIVTHCERGLQPQYDEGGDVAVVNTKHMGKQFLSDDFERCSQESWIKQKKARLKQHDVLFYSTGAYLGRTNCWLGDETAIASNHVTIIRPNGECNPVFLALFMNSRVGLMQADRRAHGSAQREVYPSDLRAYTVWLPSVKKQEKLAQMVLDAKETRDESRRLLEDAKAMVEKAMLGTE